MTLGACPSGQPPGGGTGLFRGSAFIIRLSSFFETEPVWSQSI